jgi:hypothetical protein
MTRTAAKGNPVLDLSQQRTTAQMTMYGVDGHIGHAVQISDSEETEDGE